MRSWKVLWKNERGDILPFALAALAMGVLLIAPLLAHVSSSHTTVDASRVIMGRHYASDAGVEYGLYVLQNQPSVRETAIALRPSPVSLFDDDDYEERPQVNGETLEVEIWYVGNITVTQSVTEATTLGWVLWADSTSANHTIQTTGAGHNITGDVHSNHKIFISGSEHVITGTVSYVSSFDGSGVTIVPGPAQQVGVLQRPISWDIADFAPGGSHAVAAEAEGKYYLHSSWPYDGAGALVPEGLHYVNGTVSMQGASIVRPNVTIVATGDITLSGSNVEYTPYITKPVPLVFFSDYSKKENKGINLSGSDIHIRGVSYAPRGEISLTGSGGVIKGAFIGGVVKVAGSGTQIMLEKLDIPSEGIVSQTAFIEVYDVRSSAGGTETTARLWKNEDGTWRILSWFVQ